MDYKKGILLYCIHSAAFMTVRQTRRRRPSTIVYSCRIIHIICPLHHLFASYEFSSENRNGKWQKTVDLCERTSRVHQYWRVRLISKDILDLYKMSWKTCIYAIHETTVACTCSNDFYHVFRSEKHRSNDLFRVDSAVGVSCINFALLLSIWHIVQTLIRQHLRLLNPHCRLFASMVRFGLMPGNKKQFR